MEVSEILKAGVRMLGQPEVQELGFSLKSATTNSSPSCIVAY